MFDFYFNLCDLLEFFLLLRFSSSNFKVFKSDSVTRGDKGTREKKVRLALSIGVVKRFKIHLRLEIDRYSLFPGLLNGIWTPFHTFSSLVLEKQHLKTPGD